MARKEAKKTRGGLRRCGTLGTISEGSDARSASEEDEEEEDESPVGGRKKRTASVHLEAKSPKRGKTLLPEESTAVADSSPAWDPRAQPLVNPKIDSGVPLRRAPLPAAAGSSFTPASPP